MDIISRCEAKALIPQSQYRSVAEIRDASRQAKAGKVRERNRQRHEADPDKRRAEAAREVLTMSDRAIITRAEAKALGLKRYYTEPCKHGHDAERLVCNKACVVCHAEAMRKYYGANSEKRRAEPAREVLTVSGRSIVTRADALAIGLTRYYAGPCKRGHDAERRVDNRTCVVCHAEERRMAHEADPDKRREQCRQWREANPERNAIKARNHRAMKRNAPGSHTADDIKFLYIIQNNCCAACDASFDQVKAHVDHIVALANGGSNDASNLQLLCGPCNTSKGAKDWETWLLAQMLQTA